MRWLWVFTLFIALALLVVAARAAQGQAIERAVPQRNWGRAEQEGGWL